MFCTLNLQVNYALQVAPQVEDGRCENQAIVEATNLVHFVLSICLGSENPKTALHHG
jgi:hypothetical protein